MLHFVATALSLLLLNGLVAKAADPPITIQVGQGGLMFSPSNVTASNGTIVTFAFNGVHSATQSTFGAPCTHNGFNSAPQSAGKSWTIVIDDDSHPIWFYCNVATHCGTGMVGSINAPDTGNTFDAFHSAAVALGSGEPAQTDASTPVSSGVGAVATSVSSPTGSGSSASATSPGSTATGSAAPSTTSKSGASQQLSANAGVALVGGALALLAAST